MTNWTEVTAIATSVAALGAILAAAFAGKAFSRQTEQLRLLERQEQSQQDDKRTVQAALVSAWTESEKLDKQNERTKVTVRVIVRNGSTEPVWNCTVRVRKGSAIEPIGHGSAWVPVLPPTTDKPLSIEFDVPPSITGQVQDILVQDADGNNWGRDPSVELEFHDAAMRKWKRTDGRLVEELEPLSPTTR